MFGLGFSRPRDTRKLARRFLENVENTSQSGKRARTKWTPHSKSKGRARHMIPKRFSMVQEAAAKRQTNLVRPASPVYPSASDLCSQLVGNSGICPLNFRGHICGSVGSTVPEYRSVVRISHKLTGNDFAARRTGIVFFQFRQLFP